MGPDTVVFVPPVLILIGDKTTTRAGRGVDKRDVSDNIHITDLCRVWGEDTKLVAKRTKFRQYIYEKANARELKGIVRIHFAFPYASRESNGFFLPCTTWNLIVTVVLLFSCLTSFPFLFRIHHCLSAHLQHLSRQKRKE